MVLLVLIPKYIAYQVRHCLTVLPQMLHQFGFSNRVRPIHAGT